MKSFLIFAASAAWLIGELITALPAFWAVIPRSVRLTPAGQLNTAEVNHRRNPSGFFPFQASAYAALSIMVPAIT